MTEHETRSDRAALAELGIVLIFAGFAVGSFVVAVVRTIRCFLWRVSQTRSLRKG